MFNCDLRRNVFRYPSYKIKKRQLHLFNYLEKNSLCMKIRRGSTAKLYITYVRWYLVTPWRRSLSRKLFSGLIWLWRNFLRKSLLRVIWNSKCFFPRFLRISICENIYDFRTKYECTHEVSNFIKEKHQQTWNSGVAVAYFLCLTWLFTDLN